MRILSSLAVLVIVAVALAACADSTPQESGDTGPAPELVVAQVDRAEPDPALARTTADALTQFALDLYGELPADGNLVFSPYSAYIALAMARAGAAGQTLDEMSAVLHADTAGDLDGGLNAISQALQQRPGDFENFGHPVTLELSNANQIWSQNGQQLLDTFLTTLGREYGAGVRLVDFASATEAARQAINAWVSDQTRARIPTLLAPGVIDPSTQLVLTNAIYLNAPWAFPFNPHDTTPTPFTRLDGSTVDALLMHQQTQYPYLAGDGFQAVELDYINHELSMLVIVPDAGGFDDVAATFNAATLLALPERLHFATVDLRFPQFEFRTPSPLNAPLTALGMPTAFTDGADFSRFTGTPGFSISAVVHEAFIAVDELGTEAAAATAVTVPTSLPINIVELTVDRPFLFLIRDKATGAILFFGRVLDPTQ